jgi:hypothetical protein
VPHFWPILPEVGLLTFVQPDFDIPLPPPESLAGWL